MDLAALYEVKKLKGYARNKLEEGFSREEIRPMIILKLTKTSLITGACGVPTAKIADFILGTL